MRLSSRLHLSAILALLLTTLFGPSTAWAQDRIRSMPGFERYQEISPQIRGSMVSGALSVTWAEDGGSFEYAFDGKLYRFDITKGEAELLPGEPPDPRSRFMRRGGPARGRQFDSADSPDGIHKAFYRDRNLYLSGLDGSGEMALTTDGNEADRIKNGTASWVYGEELGQNTAMWWSPDGSKLAYYRFAESPVKDYYLQMDQTQIQIHFFPQKQLF